MGIALKKKKKKRDFELGEAQIIAFLLANILDRPSDETHMREV